MAPLHRGPPPIQEESLCFSVLPWNQCDLAIVASAHRSLNERKFANKSIRCRPGSAEKVWAVTFQFGIHRGNVIEGHLQPKRCPQQGLSFLASHGRR